MPFAKGPRQKNRDGYLGGAAQGGFQRGLSGQWGPFLLRTTLRRFLFRPHCPPGQHMAALYSTSLSVQQDKQVQALSTLSRISITGRRVHVRPLAKTLETFFIRLESFRRRVIVRNLDIFLLYKYNKFFDLFSDYHKSFLLFHFQNYQVSMYKNNSIILSSFIKSLKD